MTAALHRHRHNTVPILLVLGLLLAWLPASAAWGDARDISEDLCSTPYQSDFDDIAGSAHEEMIRCMADHALTEGVGDGSSYGPRRDVTRGQMASFVARFLEAYTDEPLPDGNPRRFDDVPENDDTYPHATNIHSLAEIEVVEGTSSSGGDAYAPQNGVTRAQMASMIRRALAWADDGDARNDSAPPAGQQGAFPDTAGSVHEDNIDAIAAVGIVQGFGDGTYRPGNLVKRDQMASFVMRSYDYALEEQLGHDDDDPEPQPGPVAILSPTTAAPAFPVSPGDEVDITFRTDRAGDYELEFRDPNPDSGSGFPLIPDDDEGTGDWTAFDGDEASGTVDEGDTFDVTVTLPDDEEDEGVRDIRLSFAPADDETTTITNQQDAAIIVGDGVVINLTQERIDFEIQAAVDEADAGDSLLAIGAFEETVELDEDDLLLSGLGPDDTVLEGTILIEGVSGVMVSDLTVTDYATTGTFAPLMGDEIGILVDDASDITLERLHFEGSGSDSDDIGIAISDEVDGVEVSGSSLRDNGTAIHTGSEATLAANDFEGNGGAILVDEANEVVIHANEFDGHDGFTIHLEEGARFATIEGNQFGDDTAEHIRFFANDYSSADEQDFLDDNTYASEPEVVDDDDDRVIRPVEDDDNDDE